ncbi:hypothetical protein, conserved [Eimeria maxima]|uniref:Uncharacterized protein n=1 Tax=Eimeria maxima TaxID=5804 RepID=U6M369_EIMMA|nr:hypothetical protein, conserved [Eimeria maxima]CDJ56120.1 hypothetical protein, conserved [Eimeria maxima]
MTYPRENWDIAALMSQQRFLRQQEQQMRAEVLRLSRTTPFALPQDRPLPPPPPQEPIERRVCRAAPCYRGGEDAELGAFEGGPGCSRSSWRYIERLEEGAPGGMAAAVSRRQNELLQLQRERQEQILRQQRFFRRPVSYGTTMEGLHQNGRELSPYTFELFSHESMQGLPRPRRSATVAMNCGGEAKQWVSPTEKRQLARISPCALPAAGMPSGRGRRSGEDWCPTRQRRQVLPGYALEASPPLLQASDAWPLHANPKDASRQATSNPLPCGYAGGGAQGPAGCCVPSTLPPALHPEPEKFSLLSTLPSQLENSSKEVLPAGLPSQHRGRNGSNAFYGTTLPCCGVHANLSEPQVENQTTKFEDQRRGVFYSKRQHHELNAEVPAGKPSSQLGCGIWGFQQSLRAPDEVKTSVGRQAVHTRPLAASNNVSTTCHFAGTGRPVADDEETLKQLGVSFSPRELLFFRKQPNTRGARQRMVPKKRSRSCKPSGTERVSTDLPLKRGVSGSGLHMCKGVDAVIPAPKPDIWTIPSWMRAYGVSGTPAAHHEWVGGQRQFPPASFSAALRSRRPKFCPADSPEDPVVGRDDDECGMPCGCRCCRLRAAPVPESGITYSDRQCCCCPCCSWARNEGGNPHVDSTGLGGESGTGQKDAGTAGETGKCSRCGKRSVTAPMARHQQQHGALPRGLEDRTYLEQPAPLCSACAAYLACERERQQPALPVPSTACSHDMRDASVINEDSPNANEKHSATQECGLRSNKFAHNKGSCKVSTAKTEQEEPGAAPTAPRNCRQMLGDTSSQKRRSVQAEMRTDQYVRLPLARQLCTSSKGPPESNSVWESPRIVAKICQYLSLSKLLLVRRCNKTLLQAAQYRMRFILYNSLFVLMHQDNGASASQLVKMAGQHCPLSPDALIQLLGLQPNEVEDVQAGNLPPAYPPEAATPRMQDVAAAILRSLAELEESTKSKTSPKPKFSGNHPASCRNPTQPSEPTPTTWKNDTSPAERRNGVRKTEAQQQMLLDEHMEKQQAQEEAYLELLQDQIDRPVNFAYDEAAGPVASSHVLPYEKSITGSAEPATFRRVRHAFLKLWNYDDEAFRLVAQPFISPDVLTRGSGVDANTLYHAAVGGAGVTPLVLRPTVVDSLELKMSKVSPEFIAEFLTYGRQQQLLHSPEYQRPPRGSIRQFKAASELILMMDLYEWLASVLTHMQNTEVSTLMHANSSTLAGAPERNQTKGEIQGAGCLFMITMTALELQLTDIRPVLAISNKATATVPESSEDKDSITIASRTVSGKGST